MKDTLLGRRFGRLIVLSYLGRQGRHNFHYWQCRCDCGNEKLLDSQRLKSGNTTNCGCAKRDTTITRNKSKQIDLTGQKFGRLTAIAQVDRESKSAYWLCECECGVQKAIVSSSLRGGVTRSCGCLQKELLSARRQSHGHSKGGTLTPTYYSWMGAKNRCRNANDEHHWERYGGAGVRMCDRWANSFETFLEDMGERPEGMTLDRKDNSKGYFKENCRWATRQTQTFNRAYTVKVSYQGETLTLPQLAKRVKLGYDGLRDRIVKKGMPVEEAIAETRHWYNLKGKRIYDD